MKPPMQHRADYALVVFDTICANPNISLDTICAKLSLFRPEVGAATGYLLDRRMIERTETGFIVHVRKRKAKPAGRKAMLKALEAVLAG